MAFVQVGPASQPDNRPRPSSMPDPRIAQLDARAASMERRATVAEAENSSLQQQLKSLQGIQAAGCCKPGTKCISSAAKTIGCPSST